MPSYPGLQRQPPSTVGSLDMRPVSRQNRARHCPSLNLASCDYAACTLACNLTANRSADPQLRLRGWRSHRIRSPGCVWRRMLCRVSRSYDVPLTSVATTLNLAPKRCMYLLAPSRSCGGGLGVWVDVDSRAESCCCWMWFTSVLQTKIGRWHCLAAAAAAAATQAISHAVRYAQSACSPCHHDCGESHDDDQVGEPSPESAPSHLSLRRPDADIDGCGLTVQAAEDELCRLVGHHILPVACNVHVVEDHHPPAILWLDPSQLFGRETFTLWQACVFF